MVVRILAMLALVACSRSEPAASASKVEILTAPAGSAATYIASELTRGARDGVPVLVYVGATWCEPCRDFHDAAAAGKLDAALAPIRFLEFDLDRDGERLAAAGVSVGARAAVRTASAQGLRRAAARSRRASSARCRTTRSRARSRPR